MSKIYYIEYGPKHIRTFVEKPSKPLGPLVEISEDEYLKLRHIHPSLWVLKGNKVVKKTSLKPGIKLVVALLVGIMIGWLI